MKREIQIERCLTQELNGSEFERFGNMYLRYHYKNAYSQTKLGLQIANNSTVTGQPDAYFTLPNHKFKFAEFTAQKKNLVTKLKTDLQSCLNEQLHGIPSEQITTIDLVYCGKLTAKQQIALSKPATSLDIIVVFHGIDRLVNAVIDDIRLAKAISIPIDTGQILTDKEFIDYYERSRLTIGTPLSNDYVERHDFDRLSQKLTDHNIVVIRGKPGCGKTKLAVEYIQRFIVNQPDSEGYCIVSQPPAIWEDAMAYFLDGKQYVVLIDDANRQVDNLLAVLSHLNRLKNGVTKVLITVRGYAYDEVCRELRTNQYQFEEVAIGQLEEEQIDTVLQSSSFSILNGDTRYKINRLTKNNVRLAIMIATLIKQNGYNVSTLADVGDAYDTYYQMVLPDQAIWDDINYLRVLGLTAVLRSIDMTDVSKVQLVLTTLDLTVTELWKHIRHLETLEIIEVYKGNAFRFTEQIFATYTFYQCFFKRQALDLTQLLHDFDETEGYRIKDSIFSVYESYDKERVTQWIEPILTSFYTSLTDNRLRLNFLTMYTRFLPGEVLFFINDFVLGRVMPASISRFETDINKNVIDLLFSCLTYTNSKSEATIGYELIIKLLEKEMATLDDIVKRLESYIAQRYDYIDYQMHGIREEQYDWLSDYLVERGLQGSLIHSQLMDGTLKRFLLMFYDEIDSPPIYRDRIWRYVQHRFTVASDSVKSVICDYMTAGYGKLDERYVQADIARVTNLVMTYFNPMDPLDCHFVHEYANSLNKLPLSYRTYQALALEFNGELFQLYCLLSFEHIKRRYRNEINISGSPTLRESKVSEICTLFSFRDLAEFEIFYKKLLVVWQIMVRHKDGTYLSQGFIEGLLSIAKCDSALFKSIFSYLLCVGFPSTYFDEPGLLKTIMQQEYLQAETVYALIIPVTDKTAWWLYSFFWSLPVEETNAVWADRLAEYLPVLALHAPNGLSIVRFIKQYVPYSRRIPTLLVQSLWDVKHIHGNLIKLYDDFIEIYGQSIDQTLTSILEQIYLEQYLTKQDYDHDRKALAVLLERRRGFWSDFLKAHYPKEGYFIHDFGTLSFVWEREDYYELITEGLQLVKDRKTYTIHRQDVESYFKSVASNNATKVSSFLHRFVAANSREIDMMNAIYLSLLKHRSNDARQFVPLFLTYNASIEDFDKIDWIGKGGTYSGNTIIGDVRAQSWIDVLFQVQAMNNSLLFLDYQRYIKQRIEREYVYGHDERRRSFLGGRY